MSRIHPGSLSLSSITTHKRCREPLKVVTIVASGAYKFQRNAIVRRSGSDCKTHGRRPTRTAVHSTWHNVDNARRFESERVVLRSASIAIRGKIERLRRKRLSTLNDKPHRNPWHCISDREQSHVSFLSTCHMACDSVLRPLF
jgi:hypothetical protein